MKQINMSAIMVALVMMVLMTGCRKNVETTTTETKPVSINVKRVTQNISEAERIYVGVVESELNIPLSFLLGGEIQEIYVRNGNSLKKGDVIARVDDSSAKSMHEVALATLKQAEDGYDRLQRVHEGGGISDVRWVQMKTDLEKARQTELSARERLENCTMRAPRDGMVTAMDKVVGQSLRPSETFCKLIDIKNMLVQFSVPEKEIQNVRVGMKTTGMLCAKENQWLDLEIEDISMTANPMGHTYNVRARILTKGLDLLPGMVAKVRMNSSGVTGIVLPSDCIRVMRDGICVWVVKDNVVERRNIEVSEFVQNGVMVTKGLQEGDLVVTKGYQKLYNDCQVAIQTIE